MSLRPKSSAYPLSGDQLLELTLGPTEAPVFDDEAEARAAWEANMARLIKQAADAHHAGWRPDGYWVFDAGRPDLAGDDTPEVVRDRLLWLRDHRAWLPGESAAMWRAARADRKRREALAKASGRDPDDYEKSSATEALEILEENPA